MKLHLQNVFLIVTTLLLAPSLSKPCNQLTQKRCVSRSSKCDWYNGKCGDVAEPKYADACLTDVSKCTTYPKGVFASDYPRRFEDRECYKERPDALEEGQCEGVCDELFEENPQWGPKVRRACRVGCMYARNWHARNKRTPSCMRRCKTTVWNRGRTSKCNFKKGLGIDVWEIQYFGAGIACELGCLIGRERPCTDCPT